MLHRNLNVITLYRLLLHNGRFLSENSVIFGRTLATTSQLQHEVFKRTKPLCNICTIGSLQSGKTTLTSAITKYLSEINMAKFMKYDDIDNKVDEKERGYSIHVTHVNYDTEKRHYVHSDCPGHVKHISNLITGLSNATAVILVVDVNQGPDHLAIEQMQIAKFMGIEHIIVYINKVDTAENKERVEIADLEVRESLFDAGYNGDDATVIYGSALHVLEGKDPELGKESVAKLLSATDKIPSFKYDTEKPFLLPVKNVFSISSKGVVIAGFLDRGIMKKNTECEIIGYNKKFKTTTKELERFYQTLEEAKPGDWMTTLIGGVQRDDIKRGMVVCKPGSVDMHDHAEVQFHMLPAKNKGSTDESIPNHSEFMVFSKTWEVSSRVNLIDMEEMKPGEDGKLKLIMNKAVFIEAGQKFILRNRSGTVAGGVVTKVLPNLTPEDKLQLEKERRLRKKMKQT